MVLKKISFFYLFREKIRVPCLIHALGWLIRDIPLYRLCILFWNWSKRLWPPPLCSHPPFFYEHTCWKHCIIRRVGHSWLPLYSVKLTQTSQFSFSSESLSSEGATIACDFVDWWGVAFARPTSVVARVNRPVHVWMFDRSKCQQVPQLVNSFWNQNKFLGWCSSVFLNMNTKQKHIQDALLALIFAFASAEAFVLKKR